MESIAINNGHLIVKDRGRIIEDLTRLNTRLRFAYEKPGVAISIGQMSASGSEMNIRKLAGDLRFDRGSIVARALTVQTDRTDLVTTVSYTGAAERVLDVHLAADRLSLPEIGRYFRPVATIKLEPAVSIRARGTLDALNLDVNVVSSAGTARGPLVGHFGSGAKSVEGRLDVQDIDMAPILNRAMEARVEGAAGFNGLHPAQSTSSRRRVWKAWVPKLHMSVRRCYQPPSCVASKRLGDGAARQRRQQSRCCSGLPSLTTWRVPFGIRHARRRHGFVPAWKTSDGDISSSSGREWRGTGELAEST